MMDRRPILIAGAGPTGMMAALELSRLGVPVRIVDKAPERSRTSRALAIQARTLELLAQRGLADEMVRIGNRAPTVHIHSERKRMGSIDLSRIPSRYNFVLLLAQNETERLLCERLSKAGVEIERATELVAVAQHTDRVDVVVRGKNGLEEIATPYLVCAEGAHSVVRRTINFDFHGKSLDQRYALADLHIDGDLPDDALSIFVADRTFMAVFPMGQRRFRMIATDPERRTEGEPTIAEMQQHFDGASHIPAKLRDPVWTSRFQINSRMLATFQSGRIFFGGDSAHIHSPAGGQGMNTGIQDMINLGWKLALAYTGNADPKLLDTYSAERVPVIQRLLSTTERATDAFTSHSALFHQLMTHVAPSLLGVDAVQTQGARMLAQIEIGYRDSSLSQTQHASGELRAGDRVPDIDGALYAELDPSRFTVLVHGDVSEPSVPNAKVIRLAAPPPGFAHNAWIAAVRPDAYLGFVGNGDSHGQLERWLKQFAIPTSH